MPRRAAHFARCVPCLCACPVVGEQRPAIRRPCEQGGEKAARTAYDPGSPGDRARLMRGCPTHRDQERNPMNMHIDNRTITKAYARWAPVYDLVFGAVFERGRQAAIAAAERVGGRVLEVGVGTGISLPDYARATRLFGVDISEAMLRKARERVAELDLSNVEGLAM